MIKKGDSVHIRGSKGGSRDGTVVELRDRDNLPKITVEGDELANETVRALLEQVACSAVALISFKHGEETMVFAALKLPIGWTDLQGQLLEIQAKPAE